MCFVAPVALAACAAPPARAPNRARPLDERRALEVIRRAVEAEGARPAPARSVMAVGGKALVVDVGVEGHAYGVAFITSEDAATLGAAFPQRNQKDERLHLYRAGEGGEVRVVLLYQENYVFDDLAGDAHEQTAITCEAQLARDVRDFLTYARARRYP
jgi:hypothetical protein